MISEQSPWFPLREGIPARAKASQDNPTPASELLPVAQGCTEEQTTAPTVWATAVGRCRCWRGCCLKGCWRLGR